jgi:tRNA1(Val) A37 N6-methylase TrmN6
MHNTDEYEADFTQDSFYRGKVAVCQEKKGYRFSVDAPILADFLPSVPGEDALEVGTGSGIVALLALYKKKFANVNALEIQPSLARLAAMNAEKNGFSQCMQVVTGDFNRLFRDFTGIRHIFSNPPYFQLNSGRLSPNPQIRDAKTETRLTLHQLLEKSYAILGKKGSLYLVLPHTRSRQAMEIAEGTGFCIARKREVFSFRDGNIERFLVQLTNYRVSPETLPPLIIFKQKGVYTEEMDSILNGER